jgi:hypothetical protein
VRNLKPEGVKDIKGYRLDAGRGAGARWLRGIYARMHEAAIGYLAILSEWGFLG